jgi:hypothetical protein
LPRARTDQARKRAIEATHAGYAYQHTGRLTAHIAACIALYCQEYMEALMALPEEEFGVAEALEASVYGQAAKEWAHGRYVQNAE